MAPPIPLDSYASCFTIPRVARLPSRWWTFGSIAGGAALLQLAFSLSGNRLRFWDGLFIVSTSATLAVILSEVLLRGA